MKKIFLVLFGLISIGFLYCNEGIKVSKELIGKSLKLNGLLGSINYIEENDTKEEVPDYLMEGIKEKLIKEYGEDSEYIYEKLTLFNELTFGYNPIFADHVFNSNLHVYSMDRKKASFGNIHHYYIEQGNKLVRDVFNYSKGISNDEKGIIRVGKQEKLPKDFIGDFYFVLPNIITKTYSLSAAINDEEYVPIFVAEDGGYSMYAFNKETKNINNKEEIKFIFKNKKGEKEEKIELIYEVRLINKDIFNEMITELDRIDKKLRIENPEVCYNFASYLHNEEYKYKEASKINEAVYSDIDNLSSIYDKEKEYFLNNDKDLLNTKFALYENDCFIIGLKSVYLSSIDNTVVFTK